MNKNENKILDNKLFKKLPAAWISMICCRNQHFQHFFLGILLPLGLRLRDIRKKLSVTLHVYYMYI